MQKTGELQKEEQKKEYEKYVNRITPKVSLPISMGKAFLTGGLICAAGQGFMQLGSYLGLDRETAGTWSSILLILVSVLLTGLGLYPGIAKFGGAGTLVPITGFANSVAAPAIEYKTEGQVFGVGCKIFTIAGPVILYGVLSSWILGVIYYLLRMWGITG